MTEPRRDQEAATTERGPMDRYFEISARGSTLAREIRGGVVTFFAMAYIVVLNPLIIGTVPDSTGEFLGGGDEPNLALVAAATALVAGVVTILMGVFAKFPLALATGLGLNAFVAFSVAAEMTWADAMGIVVIEGAIIAILVLTGFRRAVFNAVPPELKTAISVGIGLFLAFVGFVNAGFVRPGEGTPVQLGTTGFLSGWPVLVFVVGLITIAILFVRRVRGAILYGVVGATVLAVVVETIGRIGPVSEDTPTGWQLTVPALPDAVVQVPDFSLLGQFSLLGSFERAGIVVAVLFVFTLMLADFFDTMGTMTAVATEGGLLQEDGTPPRTQRILLVDAIATMGGGAAAVSTNTSYIESAAGVGEGARTGLASVVTGACFLLATVFAPVVEIIPYEAATPALIVVGFLMMTQVVGIPWQRYDIAIPAFLTITLMPFTYSISVGIGAGFVSYVLLQVVSGKARSVHPLLWVVGALFVVYFMMEPIQQLAGIG